METYVVLAQLKAGGAAALRNNPDRVAELSDDARRLGAKIITQYATLGEYDFLTVIEAPDNRAAKSIAAEISTGAVRLNVHPAVRFDRFVERLKQQPYRTEPHRWQTAPWAQLVRRAGRYWTTTRYVRQFCRPLTVEGRDDLTGFAGPAIVIANHSSHLDSPVVFSALPPSIANRLAMAAAADKFYAARKKRTWWYSLFQNAFPVNRGGGTKQLDYPLALLKRGWSILIYPEGGRSKTGQIARFKAGPTIMAMTAKVPVIPIYMEGLRAVMPKGSREPRAAAVSARLGRPVSLEGITSITEGTTLLENAMRELAGMPPHRAEAQREGEMAPAHAAGGG